MGNATGFLTLLATTTTPSLLLHRRYTSLLRLTNHRLPRPLSSISHRRFHHHHHHHHHSNRGSNFNLLLSSPHPLKLNASHTSLSTQAASIHFTDSSSSYPAAHPWPEWSSFIQNLYNSGYYDCSTQGFGIGADEFVSVTSFPEEFIRAATACLAFAYEKPDFLGMLSRRNIEVLVENGAPFLFKNGEESLRRMRVLLGGNGCGDSNGVTADRAQTVDLMRFLVSYASAVVSSGNNIRSDIELAESSVRNLLSELAWLSYVAPDANLSGSVQNQLPGAYGQPPRTFQQSTQMKKGDWVCPSCSFMNFARNMKCFECDEARLKRKLTGGEWECPQCNFFNYVRNVVCLRCDCKRPGGLPHERTGSGLGIRPGNISSAYDAELKSRLAANEEKAQRWFSKISQMDGTSDMSTAIEDEDFPEIMPLRKGVNRFVVSTRKTPLERRLANAQHQGNLGPGGILDNKSMQSTDNTEKQNVSWSVDDIIGHKSSVFELGNKTLGSGQDDGTNNSLLITNSAFTHSSTAKGSNSDFVPFPGKEPENSKMDESSKVGIENQFLSSSSGRDTGAASGGNDGQSGDSWQPSEKPLSHDKDMEQAEKSGKWFRRVAELHNVADVASSILDGDLPEIMPTRKGQNRFVVSKKKDRSLTSPAYKRREAMEQSNNINFVPFVPFPPNYFARKDNQQPDGQDLANKTAGVMPNSPTLENFSEKINDTRPRLQVTPDMKRAVNHEYPTGSRNSGHGIPMSANSTQNVIDHGPQSWNGYNHGYTMNENMSSRENMMSNSKQNFGNNQTGVGDSMKGGASWRENTNETSNSTGTTAQTSENLNIGDSWSGKSLEGSAVKKEPDPLDMSEEAKAERWFRRVAQIKNISELSQIPDEDFPSIMPMRKGVNRFVVSKRKTPLERRLTSPQYRRNLPTVSSDPLKESDKSRYNI